MRQFEVVSLHTTKQIVHVVEAYVIIDAIEIVRSLELATATTFLRVVAAKEL